MAARLRKLGLALGRAAASERARGDIAARLAQREQADRERRARRRTRPGR